MGFDSPQIQLACDPASNLSRSGAPRQALPLPSLYLRRLEIMHGADTVSCCIVVSADALALAVCKEQAISPQLLALCTKECHSGMMRTDPNEPLPPPSCHWGRLLYLCLLGTVWLAGRGREQYSPVG